MKARLLARPGRRSNPGATPELRNRVYFHGTQDPFAESVLRTWTLEPRSETQVFRHRPRQWLDPMVGRVYLSQDPTHAMDYMSLTRGKAVHPVGLLTEVDGRNLGEVEPDEDAVGKATFIAGAGSYWMDDDVEQAMGEAMWAKGPTDQWNQRTPFAERILAVAQRELTPRQLEHVMGEWGDPDVSMLAKIGKKMLPHLRDDDLIELMELGVNVANLGPVPIARAWACPSSFSARLRIGSVDRMLKECIAVDDVDDYRRARAMLLEDPAVTSRA